MLQSVIAATREAITELIEKSKISAGELLVVGCSTSEVSGKTIGTSANLELGEALFSEIQAVAREKGIAIAAQCCEHLNRALIVERETAMRFSLDIVNCVPVQNAGGSFATAAYAGFSDAVAVESLKQSATAGIDIGMTLIGMHLRPVVVPVRLATTKIGEATIICARSRPKFVGGARAHYNENLL